MRMTLTRRLARIEVLAQPPPSHDEAQPLVAPEGSHALWHGPRADRLAACEHDLELFGRVYCPERFQDQTPSFHHELFGIAEALEETPGRGAVLAAPRNHGKSTVLSFLLPIHRLVYRRKQFIVVISDTHYQATLLVSDLKQELEENPWLRADFGDLVGPGKWTADDFVTRNGARVIARGTGSKLRGIRHRASRPDLVVGDDLENDEHVQTPEQRAKIWDWFNRAVVPMLDPRSGTLIVVGTVLHFDSLLEKLLRLDDIYRTRRYQTPMPDGTPLWPERFSLEKLAAIKRQIGSLAFNSEYLNTPIDETTQVFKPEWWNWYTKEDVVFDQAAACWSFRGQSLTLYQGIDPAISPDRRADYFAHVTIGVTAQEDVLVLSAWQDRLDFPSQVQKVVEAYEQWSPRLVGIEINAYQRALKEQVLRERFLPIREIDNARASLPAVEDASVAGLPREVSHHARQLRIPGTVKATRIVSRSVLAERGQLWLREALPSEEGRARDEVGGRRVHHTAQALFEQATQYPRSAHDDLLDALDNAIQCCRGGPPWGTVWF
jgi:hypothetical protein